MQLWRGLWALSLIAATQPLNAIYNTPVMNLSPGPTGNAPPAAPTPPPINTKLSPNPKKVTRPKPSDLHPKYLAKPNASVGLVNNQAPNPQVDMSDLCLEMLVEVQLTAPPDERFVLNHQLLREIILSELNLCRIQCRQEAPSHNAHPQPQIRLQVHVQPICEYYAVFMDMRLIEPACPDRITLRPNEFFQAITWEQQDSFCTRRYDITAVVKQKTEQMAKYFTVTYFANQPAPPIPPQALIRTPSKPVRPPLPPLNTISR